MSSISAAPEKIPLMTAVTVDQGSRLPNATLSMLDLSEGGVFVQTAYPAPVGTHIGVTFSLGDGPEPLRADTVVRWVRQGPPEMIPPPGMGLDFVSLDDANLERIRGVIAMHSANVDYLKRHNSMPEGAMALAPPRMSLSYDDGAPLRGDLTFLSERQLVATVALPFARRGENLRSQLEDGTVLEGGRVSWLSFIAEDSSGIPALRMGIELSLGSWGEEYVRRTTSPLGIMDFTQESSEEMMQYEVIEAIPASLTMVPTLPIEESGALPPPPPPGRVAVPISEVRSYPEPVRAIPIASNGMPALKAHGTRAVAAAARKNSDTFPIASAKSFLRSRGVTVLAASIGVVAIFSLVSMNMGNPPATKKKEVSAPSLKHQYEELVHPGQTANPITHGTGVALGVVPAAPAASAVVVDQVAAAEPDDQDPPAAPEAQPGKAKEEPGNKASQPRKKKGEKKLVKGKAQPIAFATKGKRTIISVGTQGNPGRVSHYLLANPSGIVITVKGAGLSMPKGYTKGDGRVISRIKHVPLKKGARMIVYTRKTPKRVQSLLDKGILRVRFQ